MSNIYYLFSVYDQFFTDLSRIFINRNDFNAYYGMAYAKNEVFRKGIYTHVSYVSDLIKQHDEHIDYPFLADIEKKYHIKLADLIHADRHLLRYDKHKRLLIAQTLIKKVIEELNKFDISIIFSESIDDLISYFANIYCKHQNIKFIYLIPTGMGNSLFFTDRLDAGPINLEQQFEQAKSELINNAAEGISLKNKLQEYIANQQQPSYVKTGELLYKPFQWEDILRYYSYIRGYYQDSKGFHYDKHPILLPLKRVKKIFNKIQYKNLINKKKITVDHLKKINYIIYPLHFHPEAATLIRGRWFNDQHAIIELLSKNLPVDTFLVVKEHKVSVGRRPIKFYQKIENHHNVILVNDELPVYELIKHSKGVATISSTMGIEALLLNKPVLTFGDRCYNISNNVYKVKDYTRISENIDAMLDHHFDEVDTLAFFNVIMKNKKEIESFTARKYSDNVLEEIANIIKQFVKR
jgi:hypothetical protein